MVSRTNLMMRALAWLMAERLAGPGRERVKTLGSGEQILEELMQQLEQEEQEHGGSTGG